MTWKGILYAPAGLFLFFVYAQTIFYLLGYFPAHAFFLFVAFVMALLGATYIFFVFKQNRINAYTNWSLAFSYFFIVGGNSIFLITGYSMQFLASILNALQIMAVSLLLVGLFVGRSSN